VSGAEAATLGADSAFEMRWESSIANITPPCRRRVRMMPPRTTGSSRPRPREVFFAGGIGGIGSTMRMLVLPLSVERRRSRRHEIGPAVLRPGLLIVAFVLRPKRAVAERRDPGSIDPEALEVRVRERTSRSIEGVEAPRSQGARRAHTRRYVTDEQRRERGWIGARSD
jgi:hypothetical protein